MKISFMLSEFNDLKKSCETTFTQDKQILAGIKGVNDGLLAGKNAFQKVTNVYEVSKEDFFHISMAAALVACDMQNSVNLEDDVEMSEQMEKTMEKWHVFFKIPWIGENATTLLHRLAQEHGMF